MEYLDSSSETRWRNTATGKRLKQLCAADKNGDLFLIHSRIRPNVLKLIESLIFFLVPAASAKDILNTVLYNMRIMHDRAAFTQYSTVLIVPKAHGPQWCYLHRGHVSRCPQRNGLAKRKWWGRPWKTKQHRCLIIMFPSFLLHIWWLFIIFVIFCPSSFSCCFPY